MRKICLFLSVLMCVFAVSSTYAQSPYDRDYGYDQHDSRAGANGEYAGQTSCSYNPQCPPQEKAMNDCYCLYCRYEPCYYNKWHCSYVPKYTYKKCCRYVPQYYQKQCCRYVPQYYSQTYCHQVPQYYYTRQCKYESKYNCERCCRYVPKYYYKHVCQPTCNSNSCIDATRS